MAGKGQESKRHETKESLERKQQALTRPEEINHILSHELTSWCKWVAASSAIVDG
jgi:hypothetical protein